MDIKTIKTIWAEGELKQNTHVLEFDDFIVVVDAGCSLAQVRDVSELPIRALLVTHGHYDHMQYIEEYDKLGISIYASEEIVEFLEDDEKNVSRWHTPTKFKLDNLITLKDGDKIELDNHIINCYHTPGHTKDSMCYILDDKYLFSGDTLFSVAVGRTDLPTGDIYVMIKSLENLMNHYFELVYTGHGRNSSKEEQKINIPKWIERLKEMSK